MAKKKFQQGILMAVLALALALAGTTRGANTRLVMMDILDVTTLFVAPVADRRQMVGGDRLFKITEDGYILEVNFTYEDEDGNLLTTTEASAPDLITVLSNDFLIVTFFINAYSSS
jgi:hypothetical protein